MELRSRRLIASGEARRRARLGFTPSEPDHISALPDELLLLVLARLGCVATAARTSVLARRWRGRWTSLAHTGLVFHDVAPTTVKAALARFAASPPEYAAAADPFHAGDTVFLKTDQFYFVNPSFGFFIRSVFFGSVK